MPNRKRRQRKPDSQVLAAGSPSAPRRSWPRLAAGLLIFALLAAVLVGRGWFPGDQDRPLRESPPAPQPSDRSAMASGWSPQQAFQAAQQAWQQGQAHAAERWLRQALQSRPDYLDASNRLAYILGVEGRCWEAAPLLMIAVRQGQFSLHHLVLLGALEPVIDDPQAVALCRAGRPEDRLPLVGAARTALKHNDRTPAQAWLREVVAAVPACHEAQARLGGLLVDQPLPVFQQWEAGLQPGADEHPDIWMARGQWALAHQRSPVALRCFLQATRLDPNHRLAHLQVGQLLRLLDQPQQAQPFLNRAEQLRRLGFLVDEIYKAPDDLQRMRQAAELTESLGRLWEAHAWCQWAAQTQARATPAGRSPESWPHEIGRRLQSRLEPNGPRTIADPQLLAAVDLSAYPLPDWQAAAADRPAAAVADASSDSTVGSSPRTSSAVAFVDQAAAVGMQFVFQPGRDANTGQMRMLDTTGGGVAVMDYDLDGWPDIYFTQSAPWPPQPRQHDQATEPPRDRLFRNQAGQQVADVTAAAGLGDDRYSQGATVGDFDNDGFPDLYVANFGGNRLYRNNGDGTFSDVTQTAGLTASRWTTSCLLADLNGDGLLDLYDVNYLDGTAAAQAICRTGDRVDWCDPSSFDAEQDQLFLNTGDGRFRDVSEAAGIVLPEGKGLGVVAADGDASGRLSLFIANDAVANFYFQNQTDLDDQPAIPRFSEQALLSGLAFSDEGLPQGCMGIAAEDADGDGRLDLFVTNFYDQSNALYLQPAAGQFVDASRRSGLLGPSLQQLGFGTQFLDGELDGRPDLVVANGHVLDLSHQGTPYHMPPQYFQNLGNANFQEIPSESLGAYFQGRYLGRGLALLDWNRDGRPDFVVSHIAAPAALLTNQTAGAGHFITLQLRGVHRDRDALGTTVTITHAAGTHRRQLTAGDGYQASNQRQLTFGLGTQTTIERIDVRWPSGLEQTFLHPAIDSEWLLIEGQAEPFRLLVPTLSAAAPL